MAHNEIPFRITVYSKTFARTGYIQAYEELVLNLIHNGVGSVTMRLAADHPQVGILIAEGARVVIERLDTINEFVMSGPVVKVGGEGPENRSTITFTIEDDYRILTKILGWPNPNQTIFYQGYDDQGVDLGDYHRISGPAETVLKAYVVANATRLGIPLTVGPDLRRGLDIDVRMRFHPLTDRLMPAVDQAGLGVNVRQSGLGLVVECYVPTVRTQVLSEKSGTLLAWSWNRTAPTSTRVVVGGQGEGIDRDFILKTDTAREAAWGQTFVTEVFRDARDVEIGNSSLLNKRADETLAEGGPTSGLKITLAETETFRYGKTALVGDRVTISIINGVQITDVLRSAVMSHTVSDGFLITPSVGDSSDENHDMLIAKAVSRLAEGLRNLKGR